MELASGIRPYLGHAGDVSRSGRGPGGIVALALVALVTVLVACDGSSTSDTTPRAPGPIPNAEGDRPIDVERLRFSDPLPDDVVAFIDAPDSVRPPEPVDVLSVPAEDGHPQRDSIGFVAMDGARVLMSGVVAEVGPDLDDVEIGGPDVDIGVEGARFTDDAGAIAIPVADGFRLVAPRLFFAFGGGAHVEPEVLTETARLVGSRPLEELDDVPGIVVHSGTIDGVAIDPFGALDQAVIRHGSRDLRPTVTLFRLAEPPTSAELIALGHVFVADLDGTPTIGDLSFAGPRNYVELVSPLDLLAVSSPSDPATYVSAIDFAPLGELGSAFDGVVDAPPGPRPAG